MPYIGRAATNTGSVRYLDNIASGFDGSDTTFTAQVGGVNITPDQENVRIYLDGVFQHPGSGNADTISGSTITFTEAPVANTVFSAYVVGAGAYLDDKAVSSAKLDDDAVTAAKLDDDGTGFQVGDLGVGGSLTSGDKLTVTGRARVSGGIIGDLTGNVTGNTSGTAATVTTAAQTNITSLGTLTALTLSGNITMADDTSIGISDSDERIEFDGAGDISVLGANFGIGTTSPSATDWGSANPVLAIHGTQPVISLKDTNDDKEYVLANNGGNFIVWNSDIDKYTLFLDSNSKISLSNNDSGTGNTVFGKNAGASIDAGSNYNVFIGENVSDATMNDSYSNVGVGYGSLSALTTGDRNTAIGYNTLTANTTGEENIAIGRDSMDACVSGSYNIGIGTNTLGAMADVGSTFNIAIGYDAMSTANHANIDECIAIGHSALNALGANSGATGSIAIGYQALTALTSGEGNVSIGQHSLSVETDGSYNTAVGFQSLQQQTSSVTATVGNTALGYRAGRSLTGSTGTTLIGYQAGGAATMTGNGNTAIGYDAGKAMTSAASNVIIGQEAGDALTTGASNVIIGQAALGAADGAEHNNVAIGKSAGESINHDDADNNVLIGKDAGAGGSAAFTQNIAIGVQSLDATGSAALEACVVIGYQAATAVNHTDSNGIVAIGHQAGAAALSCLNTTLVGYAAGDALTTGDNNTALGRHALGALATEDNNTAVGYQAGTALTGASNTCVGYRAGYQIVGGTGNTFIGASVDLNTSNFTNATGIGYNFEVSSSNAVFLGNSDVTSVYMASDKGATVHCSKIEVAGTSQIYGTGDYGVQVWRSDTGIMNARFYDNGDYSFRGSDQSDKDLKKNIIDIPDGSLTLVNQLKPKTYKWKVSQNLGDATKTGFIAQNVAEVFGTNESVATGTDGNKDMGINPVGLIAHLTKAVQELSAKVEALENA